MSTLQIPPQEQWPAFRNNPYSNALNVVNGASNCLGITKSLARDMQQLADEARDKKELSTEKLNQHIVMRLYLEQLVHLNTRTMINVDAKPDYEEAQALCRQMAVMRDGEDRARMEKFIFEYMEFTDTRQAMRKYIVNWANNAGLTIDGQKAQATCLGLNSLCEVWSEGRSVAIGYDVLAHLVAHHGGVIDEEEVAHNG